VIGHWRGRDLAWGQSVSVVVTHKEIYVQELGDNGGQGDLDEDDVIEADVVERVEQREAT
jgi:hypothetical protein